MDAIEQPHDQPWYSQPLLLGYAEHSSLQYYCLEFFLILQGFWAINFFVRANAMIFHYLTSYSPICFGSMITNERQNFARHAQRDTKGCDAKTRMRRKHIQEKGYLFHICWCAIPSNSTHKPEQKNVATFTPTAFDATQAERS